MRPLRMVQLVLLVAVLFSCGCASNNKGKIEGTKWTSVASTVKGRAIPAGALGLEFNSDGSMAYKIGPMSLAGTYSLGSGDSFTFKFNQDLGGKGKIHQE